MAFVQVQCPDCYSTDVVQYGKQANGTQRYRCNNRDGPRTIFLLQYQDKGRLPAVRQQIVDMTLNGSGVRDIVRVLGVSSATVIDVLKKKEPAIKQVNEKLLHTLAPPQVDVILRQVDAAEMDEMWSFVGSKSQQRWLWHAIDHHTGQILAYVFGTRADETFLKLQELLAPVGSKNSCGLARVVFQEPPEPFAALDRACTLCVWAARRKEEHIALALMMPLVMNMRHIRRQHMAE